MERCCARPARERNAARQRLPAKPDLWTSAVVCLPGVGRRRGVAIATISRVAAGNGRKEL